MTRVQPNNPPDQQRVVKSVERSLAQPPRLGWHMQEHALACVQGRV